MTTGLIGLLGSGETAAAGGRLFEALAQALPQPLHVAVLETPAGFELNAERVATRVAEFLRVRLSNYDAQVALIPARGRGTPFSPDDEEVCRPLLEADMIFAGPGSPTYAARQLAGSLAWDFVRARVGLGAGAVFASAAAIAVGRYALPVYEIYKAGHDLRWQPGLDLFDAFGLSAVFVPHWNNSEGGAELDTSRCFMGQERFAQLAALLPSDTNVFGVDEHTALVVDPTSGEGRVLGQGRVTVLHGRKEAVYADGARFDLRPLGFAPDANLFDSVPEQIAMEALAAQRAAAQRAEAQRATTDRPVPDEVLELAEARQVAREQRDWQNADRLRNEIESLGWQVQDTADGPKVLPVTAAR